MWHVNMTKVKIMNQPFKSRNTLKSYSQLRDQTRTIIKQRLKVTKLKFHNILPAN